MNKPVIKEGSFSVDDIHKLREYHYEMTKELSGEELIKQIHNEAEKIRKEIRKRKEKREKKEIAI